MESTFSQLRYRVGQNNPNPTSLAFMHRIRLHMLGCNDLIAMSLSTNVEASENDNMLAMADIITATPSTEESDR